MARKLNNIDSLSDELLSEKVFKKSNDPNYFENIIVNGCEIKPNTKYTILSKAPKKGSGDPVYEELKSCKEKMPGVSNLIYLSQANTGFNSICKVFSDDSSISGDWDERERRANLYYEVFAKPLKNVIYDIDRVVNPSDDEFFDRVYEMNNSPFSVNIYEGAVFDTTNPVQRMRLYIAAIEGGIVMKGDRTKEDRKRGLKSEMSANDAQYVYVSNSDVKKEEEVETDLKMKASFIFTSLLYNDKDLLRSILSYMDIQAPKSFTDTQLNTLYKTRIESKKEKLSFFLDINSGYKENKDKWDEIFKLNNAIKSEKASKIFKKKGSSYYFDGQVLGANVKSMIETFTKKGNEGLYENFMSNFK